MRPNILRSFIEKAVVMMRESVFVLASSANVFLMRSKIRGMLSSSGRSSSVNFVTRNAFVIFCRFSRMGEKFLSTFISVISVLLGLLYSSNVQKFNVSVAPENLEVGLAAPLAMAFIFPYSRVYMKTSLSVSPRVLDPKMMPLAFKFLRLSVILLLIKVF